MVALTWHHHSHQVQEIRLDYTDCVSSASDYNDGDGFESMPTDKVRTAFKSDKSVNARWARETDVEVRLNDTGHEVETDRCYLRFYLPDTMQPPVLFYYYMTNFYQNHRRYVDSFDASQLKGNARSYNDIKDSKCDPLRTDEDAKKPYYPCGLIANSLFNDTFSNPVRLDGNVTYEMTKDGIAWNSDRDLYGETDYAPDDVLPPPNWRDRYPNGRYTDDNPPPNLKDWEAFHVWMRTAGLPTFSKLYQRNNDDAMEEGEYQIIIEDCE